MCGACRNSIESPRYLLIDFPIVALITWGISLTQPIASTSEGKFRYALELKWVAQTVYFGPLTKIFGELKETLIRFGTATWALIEQYRVNGLFDCQYVNARGITAPRFLTL